MVAVALCVKRDAHFDILYYYIMSSNRARRHTLRRVTQDDPSLIKLNLVDNNNNNIYEDADGRFYSDNSDDYSTLSVAIANNTHLKQIEVRLSDDVPLSVTDIVFYNGLKSNSSIKNLDLWCDGRNIDGGVGHKILKVYQENSQLTAIHIYDADLQNGGDRVVRDSLRSCRNLQKVTLRNCNITDAQLLPIVDAKRGHCMLETLDLFGNYIGNAGCEAIATLLADPNCNVQALNLGHNNINEGATTIANSLVNNNKLQTINLQSNPFYLYGNPIDQSVDEVFSNVLCNTSSIEQTYSSNHTLQWLGYRCGQHLRSLLSMNMVTNKSRVAIKKILKFHPNIDMEPFLSGMQKGSKL